MGMEAKLSLKEYSNEETANKWDRLFSVLDKDDIIAYKKLQNYTYEKYYEEHKEERKEYYKAHYEKNKERRQKYYKDYYARKKAERERQNEDQAIRLSGENS